MLSRCPNCGVEVPEDVPVCPHCTWDFERRRFVSDKSEPEEAVPPPIQPPAPDPVKPPPDDLTSNPAYFAMNESGKLPGEPPPEPAAPEPAPEDLAIHPAAPAAAPDAAGLSSDAPTLSPPASSAALMPLRIKPQSMGLSGSHWVLAAALAAAVLVTGVVYYTLRPRRDARSQPQALPTPPAPAAAVPAAAAVALSSVSAAVVPAAAAVLPAPEPAPPAVAVGGSLAPGRTAVPKAAAPAADKAERWSFEGRVYDLLSLKYVYSAELTFLGPKGIKSGVTETGETGRYRIKLDALPEGGYTLLIRHPDYKNRYIEDVSPSLRQISLDERKPLARFVPAPKQLFGKPGGTLRKDFALIPKTN